MSSFGKAQLQEIKPSPGPGQYDVKIIDKNYKYTIPKQGIHPKLITSDIGPGKYEVQKPTF